MGILIDMAPTTDKQTQTHARIDLHYQGKVIGQFPLNKRNTIIGRREDCDICVPSKSASRHHAQIFSVLDQTYILDLDSKNGTAVNKQKIKKHELKNGDKIRIGKYTLKYIFPSQTD